MISLDFDSPIPLYYQLAEHLLQDIHHGRYGVGDRIPSEQQLAGVFSVGRPTVRQATEWLVQQGYLQRRRGSGTYVMQVKPRQLDLLSMAGTSAALQAGGVVDPLEIVRPLRVIDRPGVLPEEVPGRTFWCFSRLSRSAGVPLMIETFYLRRREIPDLDKVDLKTLSLSDVITEVYGEKPIRTEQRFAIEKPDREEADSLSWSRPVIRVRRLIHFQRAGPVFCEMLCRTDQFEFSQTFSI